LRSGASELSDSAFDDRFIGDRMPRNVRPLAATEGKSMVKASRRSVVLAGALVGFANRPHGSFAQEDGEGSEKSDELFTCVSMLARDQALSDEENERVLGLATALATRRAELLGQTSYSPTDLVYALSLFCFWPFKPQPAPEYQAFRDATLSELLELEPTPTELAAQFPVEALTQDFGWLFRGLEDGSLLPLIVPAFEAT
jgi:hypothetical protein